MLIPQKIGDFLKKKATTKFQRKRLPQGLLFWVEMHLHVRVTVLHFLRASATKAVDVTYNFVTEEATLNGFIKGFHTRENVVCVSTDEAKFWRPQI
jgi:hypothetical protein